MDDDIFVWIGVLALPIAVASLLLSLMSSGSLNYNFNQTQFLVDSVNVSLNETYLNSFGNITNIYENNTYINQTANLSGYVPYVNATQTVDLNNNGLENTKYISVGSTGKSSYIINQGSTNDFTKEGSFRGTFAGTNISRNIMGVSQLVSSSTHTSGTTAVYGANYEARTTHTSGTNYATIGTAINAIYQPSTGSGVVARLYGLQVNSLLRALGASTPSATTNLGLLLSYGLYPNILKGTISNSQGLQLNLNTGGVGGTQSITDASGILISEPIGSGTIGSLSGIEFSNRLYTTNATINNFRGIYIKELSGGFITNAYGLYLGKQSRGSDTNYQIYSEGGNSYFGDGNMTVNGTIFAVDYVTLSDVPDFKSSVSTLDSYYINKDLWVDDKGIIQHNKHPAFVSKTEQRVIGYIENKSYINTEVDGKIVKQEIISLVPITEKVLIEGLSSERRIVALEKMVDELNEKIKVLEKNINFDTIGINTKESLEPKKFWEFWK